MPQVAIITAETERHIADARQLLLEYAEDLGWDLSASPHFAAEIDNLPGPYAQPRGAVVLAYVDDDPAGFLGLQPVPEEARVPEIGADRFGELKRLFVRPRYRRMGIGEAVMKRAEEEARSRGYSALVLTTSAEMMPLAQGLYESLGYRETSEYRDDMPYPQIRWMKLEL